MITRAMKDELRSRGFDDDAIAQMTPEEANKLISPSAEPPNGNGGDGADFSVAPESEFEPTLAEGGQKAIDDLVLKTENDPGAPFEVVAALAALKQVNRAVFEALRARLKKAGCRVTQLDKSIAAENDEGGERETVADLLIKLSEAASLFHASDDTAYADIEVNGHRETWPIRSKGFRRWLSQRYLEEFQGGPNSEAMATAINTVEAKAHHHSAPLQEVYVRVGACDDKIYLDLCDPAWRAVEVDKSDWRIVDRPAVRFRRSPDM
jgi:hypothetical protein